MPWVRPAAVCLFLLVACGGGKGGSPGEGAGGGAGKAAGGGAPGAGTGGSAGALGAGRGGAAPNGGAGGSTATGGSAGLGSGAAGTGGAGAFGGAGLGGAAGGGAMTGTGGASGGAAGASGNGAAAGMAGTTAAGGMSGGAGAPPETWHAAVATAATDQMLASEYSNWKSKHTQTCSDGSAVVKKDEGSVVSEGIGYGMLLAVGFDDRTLFDGLFKYYTGHADPKGLMNWATGVCDAAGNNNAFAATDGDLDTLMALVQADAHWSDGGYLAKAATLAAAIVASETEMCGQRAVLRPGDNYGGCSDMSNQKLNPSYFAPGYYRVFAAKFPDQAERWTALRTGSYELYPIYQARMSGLVPDWAAIDGSDWYGAAYSYDACRTPWRVMVDYAWSGEPAAKTVLQGITGWVDKNGATSLQNNSAFVGSFALAAAYDQAKLDAAVMSWLGGNGDDTPYFQGTLRVLYLLAAAGKFPSTL